MSSKTWRTLSTRVATPFRKLSLSERSRSRSPSRQGSTDIPRSDSPAPGDLPRSRVASDAPVPVLDTTTTKPSADKDAVDLDSPTGSAKGELTDAPADPKSREVDPAPKEDKPTEVTKQEPVTEPNHVVYHAEPDEVHHEHPPVAEQHSDAHRQAAPSTKDETKLVQFAEPPEPPRVDDGALGNQVTLDDEFDLKNAPEPASAGTDDSRDFHALMGDTEVWADEGDGEITVSSPPVDRRIDRLELRRPIQIKAGAITPELTPKEELAEEQSAASEDAASVHPEQVEQSLPPANVVQGDENRRQSAGETTLDVHAESPTRAVPPQSPGVGSAFAKPYTVAHVSALSKLSNAQVIADDDDHDGTFVVRSDNQPLARLTRWTTYTLPSGETYYHHPEARVVTDVDIILPSNLRKVNEHLDQTIQAHHSHHHHRANHVAVGRLIDDTSPPNTAGLAKSEPESRDYRFSMSRDDQIGTEIWLRTVPGGETFAPMTLWVDHLSRTVAINPPWEQLTKGDGFDDGDEFDSTLRYWDFIMTHPAHTGLPAGSSEEAMEALSWCYTDWLLHPHADPRRQPFSIEECRELLTLLKTLEGPLQTHIAAKIHVRLSKHRQALNRVLESEVAQNPASTHKASKDPFGNIFVKIFVGLFCFGIPYKYVPKDDPHYLPSETDSLLQKAKGGPLLADSPIFAAALTLVAVMLVTSSVVFLALPDQENAAELSALVSLFFSVASLASSIINLERRSSGAAGDESSTHLHPRRKPHPFVQSLPLVFITWSIISLVAAIYLYIYGVEAFPGHHDAWVTRRRA
ncbi:hypothetical protein FRC00_006795 [Tulasnella sp. 408]|nr:hypothetical protein FRC00_006795 [Tulasnella sp. 408]